MLIPNLFEKWNVKPKGIIHIGAHSCEELDIYKTQAECDNIIWIEANPNYIKDGVYQALISDVTGNEVDFIITNNDAQSSSFLELKEHLVEHPHVKEINRIKLKTITLNDLMIENSLNYENYDFLAMDIQGSEFHALKGIGDMIKYFRYIYMEVNTKEIYEGCGLLPDIIKYLSKYGFTMKDINMTQHGWGDAFFEKKYYNS